MSDYAALIRPAGLSRAVPAIRVRGGLPPTALKRDVGKRQDAHWRYENAFPNRHTR